MTGVEVILIIASNVTITVSSFEQHVLCITRETKVARGEAEFLPPDVTLGIVKIQLRGHSCLHRMQGLEFRTIEDTSSIKVGVANNRQERTLRNIQNCRQGSSGVDTICKVQIGLLWLDNSFRGLGDLGPIRFGNTDELVVRVPAGSLVDQSSQHFFRKRSKA